MSEPMPEPGGGGGRILGLRPRTALIAGGVILAAARGYFLWKQKQSSSSGAASASASSSTAGAYGVDYGGELSVIQSELEGLMAAEGQEPATSSGGTGGGTGSGKIPPTYKPPVSSGGDNDSGGGGGTTTTVKPKPGIPAGVHAVRTGSSAVTLAWDKAPNATSYRVRVTYQGRLVGSPHVVAGTSATISGLHPDHTYTFHVAAVGPGGTSAETGGPSVKTTR